MKNEEKKFVNVSVNKKLVYDKGDYYTVIVPDKTVIDDLDISGRIYNVNNKFVRENTKNPKLYNIGFLEDFEVTLYKEGKDNIKVRADKLVDALKESYLQFKNSISNDINVDSQKMMSIENSKNGFGYKENITAIGLINQSINNLVKSYEGSNLEKGAIEYEIMEQFQKDINLKNMYFEENKDLIITDKIPNLSREEFEAFQIAKDKAEFLYLKEVNLALNYELLEMDKRGEINLDAEFKKDQEKAFGNKDKYDDIEI